MESERSNVLRDNLIEAVHAVLEHDGSNRHFLETLADGRRLMVHLSILSPIPMPNTVRLMMLPSMPVVDPRKA